MSEDNNNEATATTITTDTLHNDVARAELLAALEESARRWKMSAHERAGYVWRKHKSAGDEKTEHFRYIERAAEFDVGVEVAEILLYKKYAKAYPDNNTSPADQEEP